MKNIIYKIIGPKRAYITKKIKPAKSYFLATKSLKPLSSKFGYDRGTPIDRYWIEEFLRANKSHIKGVCLEITDDAYTRKFGSSRVTKSEVLDINTKNKKATIFSDLRDMENVKDETFDTIILTHVVGAIDNYQAVLSETNRVLKKGGTLLATVSCFSPTYSANENYWRFTPMGAKYAFSNIYGKNNVEVVSFGNVLTGQCFWVGMSQEELTQEQLEYNDPKYPCIVGIVAKK